MEISSVFELSFVDFLVIVGLAYFIYWMFSKQSEAKCTVDSSLEPILKRDFTLEELREYDGVKNKHILVALFDKVYDVSRSKAFYGPDGHYHTFAGHDVTRALAKSDLNAVSKISDDLNDLDFSELEEARNWESHFKGKYPIVGRVLQKDEKPTDYHGELALL